MDVSDCRNTVRKRIQAAFSILHQTPCLEMLALYFDVFYEDTCIAGSWAAYTHQWDIVYALGSNRKPLPELRSLKLHGLQGGSMFMSLFDEAPIAWLAASLRHLSFSLPESLKNEQSREQFWKEAMVRRVLQPAVNLESLAITRSRVRNWDKVPCLELSQARLDTYPRLAALSLRGIVWEDGTIDEGDIVTPPPLEDFIVRHRKTLKKLELHGCSIVTGDYGRKLPLCYWADIYKRLAEALTKLVELEVEFSVEECQSPYIYSSDIPLKTERDAPALEEFKAIVKNQGVGYSSGFRP